MVHSAVHLRRDTCRRRHGEVHGNAQLGTDLAHGPALGVQVGCTLNVQGDTVMSLSGIGRLTESGFRPSL